MEEISIFKKVIYKTKDCIKLIRVKHWIKNGLIFLPIVFSGQLFNFKSLMRILATFFIFSFMASSIYIINDIRDKEKDRKHERKCKRPIAAGRISVKQAIILDIFLIVTSISAVLLFRLNLYASILIFVYFIINLGYSMGLKNIPLLDLVILATGFVIRVMLGGAVLNIPISNWLFLTVLSMAFYLGLGKRRGEVQKSGTETRAVLKHYSKEYLDRNMIMFLSMAIIFYSLWVIGGSLYVENNPLIWTIPMIVTILMKYNMDIDNGSDGDPTEVVFHDWLLIVLMVIYGIYTIGSIYLKGV